MTLSQGYIKKSKLSLVIFLKRVKIITLNGNYDLNIIMTY